MESNENNEEDVVVENKNLKDGNGLTTEKSDKKRRTDDDDEEIKPLKNKKYKNEIINLNRIDIDDENDDGVSDTRSVDGYTNCARKFHLTPKKSVIYISVSWIIIFVLLLILIIMCCFWPYSSYKPICETSECHLISAKILGSLNKSVKPCHDFWKFSCDGWLHSNPIPNATGHWNINMYEEENVKNKIRSLINTLEILDESDSTNFKLKRFYESCMAVDYIEVDNDKSLKTIINELGGWDALRTFRQNDFNFPRVLRKLQGDYRITPYFFIEVIRDPYAPLKNIIKISPSGLSLPNKSYYKVGTDHSMKTFFETYIKDVIQLLGATSNVVNIQASSIYNYEGRIAAITPEYTDIENYTKIRLDQLNSMSASIFWSDLLKFIFPQGHVNDDSEILIVSTQYLKDISEIISTSDKTVLNNYLMWTLANKYVPYLSKPYVDVYQIFRRQSTGSKASTPRWEFCIDETIKYFTPIIDKLLSRNCNRRSAKISKVNDMFNEIKNSLSQHIQDSNRFDNKLRTWAVDKLRLMTIHVGNIIKNQATLLDMYHSLTIQYNEFFTNIKFINLFLLKLQQHDLININKNFTILSHIVKNPYKIQYTPVLNKIIFPEIKLQSDNLLVGQLPILYGTIGIELSEIFANIFGPKLGLYLTDGTMMSNVDPKYEDFLNMIEQKRSCLSSFFINIKLDDPEYIEQTSVDTTLHLSGIEIAYDTFKSLNKDKTSISLPSLEYNSNAIFFISYGQSQCSSSTLAFHDLEHNTFTTLIHEHRVKGLLRQLGAFTDAFECSKTTEMYADFRCGYVL